jgi:hypothetical protein
MLGGEEKRGPSFITSLPFPRRRGPVSSNTHPHTDTPTPTHNSHTQQPHTTAPPPLPSLNSSACLVRDELLRVLRRLQPTPDADGAHGVLPRARVLDVDAAAGLL